MLLILSNLSIGSGAVGRISQPSIDCKRMMGRQKGRWGPARREMRLRKIDSH
jgi:hypothetical protein